MNKTMPHGYAVLITALLGGAASFGASGTLSCPALAIIIKVDGDDTGMVNAQELLTSAHALRAAGCEVASDSTIMSRLEAYDADTDGNLSNDEAKAAIAAIPEAAKETLFECVKGRVEAAGCTEGPARSRSVTNEFQSDSRAHTLWHENTGTGRLELLGLLALISNLGSFDKGAQAPSTVSSTASRR